MSDLFSKIQEDLKSALKEKDEKKISTLRMLLAEIKNEEIALKKKGLLKDEEIQVVISRSVKRHHDSIASYKAGHREDLARSEEEEMKILIGYLPKQLSVSELEKIVLGVIAKTGAALPSDFGKVMSQVMRQVKGRADGRLVGEIVREKLKG